MRILALTLAAFLVATGSAEAAPLSEINSVQVQANAGLVPPYSSFVSPDGERVYFGVAAATGSAFSLPTNPLALPPLVAPGNAGEDNFQTAIQSADGQYGYFSAYTVGQTNSAKVVRVRLSDMTREGFAGVGFGQQQIFAAAISPDGQYGYWGTYNQDASFPNGQKVALVKFDLATMSPVSILNLPNDDAYPTSILISKDGATAWLGTHNGRVVQVNLQTMTRTSSVDLDGGENQVDSGLISPNDSYGYFATGQSPAKIVRVDLKTMTRVDALTLSTGQNDVNTAAISPDGQYGYFATNTSPGQVVAVRLSDMALVDTLVMGTQKDNPSTITVSPDGQFAYVATTYFEIGPPQLYFSSISRLRLAFLNTLTVSKSGDGAGAVAGSGIDCGSDCQESRLDYQNTIITLTATAAAGSTFTGFSGACSGVEPCTVNLDQARQVTANFQKLPDPNPSPDPNPDPNPDPDPTLSVDTVESKVTRKGAYITSKVTISGAGQLTQRAISGSKKQKSWCKISKTVTAGNYNLKCNLGQKGRKYLKKKPLKLTLKTVFTPTAGAALSSDRKLKIKRKR